MTSLWSPKFPLSKDPSPPQTGVHLPKGIVRRWLAVREHHATYLPKNPSLGPRNCCWEQLSKHGLQSVLEAGGQMVALPSQLKQKEKSCRGVFLLFFWKFSVTVAQEIARGRAPEVARGKPKVEHEKGHQKLHEKTESKSTRKGTRSCTRKPKVEHEEGHQKLHEKPKVEHEEGHQKLHEKNKSRAPEVARENWK